MTRIFVFLTTFLAVYAAIPFLLAILKGLLFIAAAGVVATALVALVLVGVASLAGYRH